MRSKYKLSNEDFLILFVANEFRRKGLYVLFKALSKINDAKVKLMVIGKDNKLPYIILARYLKITDKIIFISQTEHINKFYAAGDLFVLPTRYEPVGLVVMEAIASGLPVIVSKIAGSSVLIDDEKCILHNPLNEKELIEKINFFLNNKEYAKDVSNKLMQKIKHYTWERTAEKIYEVYKNIIEL
ncbi:MAG: glycosyltransferase family 4 protein [Candidatus Micrarchaeia archaeon]